MKLLIEDEVIKLQGSQKMYLKVNYSQPDYLIVITCREQEGNPFQVHKSTDRSMEV